MPMCGANIEQMRQLAQQMLTVNDWVLERSARINKRTSNAGWRGKDAEQWKADVPPQIERSITTLSALLTGAAEAVEREADEQAVISDANPGGPRPPAPPIALQPWPVNPWPDPDEWDPQPPIWGPWPDGGIPVEIWPTPGPGFGPPVDQWPGWWRPQDPGTFGPGGQWNWPGALR